MSKQSDNPPIINNNFTRVLSDFRNGQSISELSESLQKAVAAARDTGKKAKLVYSITIVPGGSEDGAMAITDEIKMKLPEPVRKSAIFYASDDNVLSRNNPNQKELKFTEVEKPQQEVVDLAAKSAAQ